MRNKNFRLIGGLLVATFFTLFFVPVMYSLLRRRPPAPEAPDGTDEKHAATSAHPAAPVEAA